MGELIAFYSLAALITVCSIGVTTVKNPVSAAILLVLDLFLIAGVYALQDAHFIAVIQVIVYAGAILILFLFVIMLLNLSPAELRGSPHKAPEYLMMLISILTAAAVGLALFIASPTGVKSVNELTTQVGNTEAIGIELFSKYAWPFELASILILLAVIASIVIAKKNTFADSSKKLERTYP